MNLRKQLRRALAALAFGPRELAQFCALGLPDPQRDIKVWLVGMGAPRDVTGRNVLAATRPLVVGIGLDDDGIRSAMPRRRLGLEFREARGDQALLGEIGLEFVDAVGLEERKACASFGLAVPPTTASQGAYCGGATWTSRMPNGVSSEDPIPLKSRWWPVSFTLFSSCISARDP